MKRNKRNVRKMKETTIGSLISTPPVTKEPKYEMPPNEYLTLFGSSSASTSGKRLDEALQPEERSIKKEDEDVSMDINDKLDDDDEEATIVTLYESVVEKDDATKIYKKLFDQLPDLIFFRNKSVKRNWSPEEVQLLEWAINSFLNKKNVSSIQCSKLDWEYIASLVPGRTEKQCQYKFSLTRKPLMNKVPWSEEEDKILFDLMTSAETQSWATIAKVLNEKCRNRHRLGKQCRERWNNNLDPSIKKEPWTNYEDIILLEKHKKLGNKWSKIAKEIPGRPENSVKNRFNSLANKMKEEVMKRREGKSCDINSALANIENEGDKFANYNWRDVLIDRKKKEMSENGEESIFKQNSSTDIKDNFEIPQKKVYLPPISSVTVNQPMHMFNPMRNNGWIDREKNVYIHSPHINFPNPLPYIDDIRHQLINTSALNSTPTSLGYNGYMDSKNPAMEKIVDDYQGLDLNKKPPSNPYMEDRTLHMYPKEVILHKEQSTPSSDNSKISEEKEILENSISYSGKDASYTIFISGKSIYAQNNETKKYVEIKSLDQLKEIAGPKKIKDPAMGSPESSAFKMWSNMAVNDSQMSEKMSSQSLTMSFLANKPQNLIFQTGSTSWSSIRHVQSPMEFNHTESPQLFGTMTSLRTPIYDVTKHSMSGLGSSQIHNQYDLEISPTSQTLLFQDQMPIKKDESKENN